MSIVKPAIDDVNTSISNMEGPLSAIYNVIGGIRENLGVAPPTGSTGPSERYLGPSWMKGYAYGGILNEPVVGTGMRTGRSYSFAENGPEKISPLTGASSSPAPARSGGGGGGNIVVVQMNNPVFQDLDTQRITMAMIAEEISRRVAPVAVYEDYNNDGPIRRMVRGGL